MKNIFNIAITLLLLSSLNVYSQCDYCFTTPIYFQGSTTIYTPNNTAVSCNYYNDISSTEKSCINSCVASYYGVTVLSDATSTYNCHNYAWHKSDGGSTTAWLNAGSGNSNLQAYWTDGSFTQVSSEPTFAGGKVLYTGDHTAITTGTAGVYKSKWGSYPLVQHAWNNVPIPYQPNNTKNYYVRSYCVCSSAPNMQLLTYGTSGGFQSNANTVNFVSASTWYNIKTNLPPCLLTGSISWNPNSTTGMYLNWYNAGDKNTEAYINLASGQSVTFFMSAPSSCGSGTRNPTWTAQSGYRMSSNTTDGTVRNYLDVEFDNTDYLEILPQEIIIFDQTSTKEEKRIDIKKVFYSKQFIGNGRTIRIDVSKLSDGIKIINLLYPKVDGKTSEQILTSTDYERRAQRIVIAN